MAEGERLGASHRITASRSHDYSGHQQTPHHTNPISSYRTTDYRKAYRVEGPGIPGEFKNRVLNVSTEHRAQTAATSLDRRASSGRDLYTGR